MPVASSHVTELALSVQFPAIETLTVLDMASLQSRFSDRYPVFQQVPTLGALSLLPESGLSITAVAPAELPRIWMISSDLQYLIQFQRDRIALNWRRTAPAEAVYPGYDQVETKFFEIFGEVNSWCVERFDRDLGRDIAEIHYVNAIPLLKEGKLRRLSETFAFFRSMGKTRQIGNFTSHWIEDIPDTKGHIQVAASIGGLPDGAPAGWLNFIGRFDATGDLPKLRHSFHACHAQIYEIYVNTTTLPAESQS